VVIAVPPQLEQPLVTAGAYAAVTTADCSGAYEVTYGAYDAE
jgi:hypothetical protein